MYKRQQGKGFFPHMFATPENMNYVGKMPKKKFYDPSSFRCVKELDEFETWYRENRHNEFDFRSESIRYCQQDVELLASGCLKFRDTLLEDFSVDIFVPRSPIFTLAGLSMEIFRLHFYDDKTLLHIPRERPIVQASKRANEYFRRKQRRIVYAENSQAEVRIGGISVDGFSDRKVYQFHGCFIHGHDCEITRARVFDRNIPVALYGQQNCACLLYTSPSPRDA